MKSIEYNAIIDNVEFVIKVKKIKKTLNIRADSKDFSLITCINPLKDENLESSDLQRKVNKLVAYKFKETF
ncbi:hypothetical protein DCO58_11755 [Helicobacter saguini]|uniref:Uncharacterized protein n=1 Tax=Helicobacter saguini TaxID=1548018 RepID=A0A347VQ87_9HELI|nr:hypothetical protein [Helicobacter saguini]MWV61035.1 hypothetical protein [Helicobacter saguini]MWV68296.1 hypothetical protein [Helicobacter saguini]MWV70239.1 hypothetical protein [Helicobacter saguini]MWV72142.1 hypothetical protein [Helicobacter saguini]TLD95204.1 hypothetical protein LS64_002235 [Helicobacter saguini]